MKLRPPAPLRVVKADRLKCGANHISLSEKHLKHLDNDLLGSYEPFKLYWLASPTDHHLSYSSSFQPEL